MPRGPKGEKRPADTNSCAVMVAKIATGEIEDPAPIRYTERRIEGREGSCRGVDTRTTVRDRQGCGKGEVG